MRRLSALVLVLSAAACGSSNSTTDVCSSFVNAVNAKGAPCGLSVSSGYLASCQSAVGACSADDKNKLNTAVSCTNGVPACSASGSSTFIDAVSNCIDQTAPTLSSSCQTALAAVSGGLVSGSTSFTAGSGSCNITFSGSTAACEEFSSSVPSSSLQSACVPSVCSSAVSGSNVSCAFSSGQCTATGMLGRCVYPNGGTPYRLTWYGAAGLTSAQAQQACQSAGGTWSST